jgi:hypothetical protein
MVYFFQIKKGTMTAYRVKTETTTKRTLYTRECAEAVAADYADAFGTAAIVVPVELSGCAGKPFVIFSL